MLSATQKQELKLFADSFINSYSQLFFSDNRIFAWLILASSFVTPYSGVSGVAAVSISIIFSRWIGFNQEVLQTGTYSSNSLMVGLAMGLYFKFSISFFVILAVITLFTTIISKAISILFSKYNLPILSLPFLASIWVLFLALRNSTAVTLNDSGIYFTNELYSIGGIQLVQFYEKLNLLGLPQVVDTYFKSLGAIFFQYNVISGFLVAIGLLIYSRIAFTLSIIGFVSGYLFVVFMYGSDVAINYNLIGFNYILSAISIGGFFLIPSRRSYLLALLSAPLIATIHSAMITIFNYWQLPIYSLPFNILMLSLLLTLRFRTHHEKLELVWYQQFTPEKNLYKHLNNKERFSNQSYFHIHPPFFGEWYVSQGHEGKITHLGDWKYAWDFVVTDEMNHTFRLPGLSLTDFYCYNAPVLAPAAGYIYNIIDEVEENQVGAVDVHQNWGNTIIIKHSDTLFSKISHIKKGSFKFHIGDYVRRGDVIANCGNSGRSPEPHIHFQMQAAPFVEAKTLRYPLSYFVEKKEGKYEFHSFDYPQERAIISRVRTTTLLKDAFGFVPGKQLKFEVSNEGSNKEIVRWEVFTDAYNSTYIYCHNTKSYAYFVNNETLHYFTDFYGNRSSLLYYFYLGAYKVLLGYYEQMEIKDTLPMHGFYSGMSRLIQDFIAPFYVYLNANYKMKFSGADDINTPSKLKINSSVSVNAGSENLKNIDFEFSLAADKINSFRVKKKNKTILAECID